MKQYLISLGLVLLSTVLYAQEVATRTLSSFARIEVNGDFDVILQAGNKEEARIESNGISVDEIKLQVKGSTLFVERKATLKNLTSESKTTVTITYTKLTELINKGSSKIIIRNKLEGNRYLLENRGSGSIEAQVLSERLVLRQVSSGSIRVKGGTKQLEIEIRGSGNVEAYELQAATAIVRIMGSGDAKITTTDQLEARITGSGNIYYKGKPEQVMVQSMGSGTARAVKETD